MHDHNILNPRQYEAIEHSDGPLLIIAGAGAGKTKTLTHRIMRLIERGVPPEAILAITFTNKAAREMRERVDALLTQTPAVDMPRRNAWPFIGTFHALGVHILKENAERLNLPRHFAIFDRNDSLRLIKQALRDAGLDPKQIEPGKILGAISREKGNGVTFEMFGARESGSYRERILADTWNRYERALFEHKALDFDDLLLRPLVLLSTSPEVRFVYQNRWKYIHVDEYQDTNRVQYELARCLVGDENNLCVVGDADQTIYTWRGANVHNILNFERDFPGATVVFLEENYRSTQKILSAANTVIAKNRLRKEKNLFTKNGEGEPLAVYTAYDENEEAKFVAETAEACIKNGVPPREIAVLYRANFQSRALETAFLEANVPYQVLGVRFFERKEVKDLLSYLRAALNLQSRADIERVINVPPRGIGKMTVQRIFLGKEAELTAAMRTRVVTFYRILSEIRNAIETKIPSEAVRFAIRATGLFEHLQNGDEEDRERLENLEELVTLAVGYDAAILDDNRPEEGIEALLADAALASDQDSLIKNQSAVKLMTVHAAKGLEFDTVFITGLEDRLFPYERDNDTEESREEERRLFYVALTRARKKVFLSYASVRTIFGARQVHMPSNFLLDIDDELLEAVAPVEKRGKVIYLD